MILEAEGDAQARIRRAQGEAEAIRLVTQAIEGAHADPANYLIAMKYLDTLKEMTSGQGNKVGVILGAFLVSYIPDRFQFEPEYRFHAWSSVSFQATDVYPVPCACSWVPPTAVTSGSLSGQEVTGRV